MQHIKLLLLTLLVCGFWSCNQGGAVPPTSLTSPDEQIKIDFLLTEEGQPAYAVSFKGKTVVDTSTLGFDLRDMPALGKGMEIQTVDVSQFSETWEMPWGEQREVINNYKQMTVSLKETAAPNRMLNIIFKAYDDGIGFRYDFPAQAGLDTLIIMDELTQFQMTGDHRTWWHPADWDCYELQYYDTKISEIDTTGKKGDNTAGFTPEHAVNTPFTMKTSDGVYLSIHEANLTDYAGMTAKVDTANLLFTSDLVASRRYGWSVKRAVPFQTPWRTIQIADRAGDLIESNLIVNLNEPSVIEDMSWFEPTKYMGIWWEMHLGLNTWKYEGGQHGATTERAKTLIDYCAEKGFGAILVEGWNTGWERWIGFPDREGVFDFVTPYPDYDLKEVVRYGKEKGVGIIMHHETSAATQTYDKMRDSAFRMMQELGIRSVKTGYVGPIQPEGEYHHGQYMVNHYRRVLKDGAKYQVAINAHEPIKATGIRRTYPNAIAREGVRGQEFNAWANDGGNKTSHLPTVAFTRLLGGPLDYTPGAFLRKLEDFGKGHGRKLNDLNTTIGHEIALYVVINSPIQMICDLPEHIGNHPFLEFIQDVGVNWETTKALDGEPGDYVVIARNERGTDKWFVGAITDETGRDVEVKLDFLEPGKTYNAKIYGDGDNAHYETNPDDYEVSLQGDLTNESTIKLTLAPGGGAAISLLPAGE
ncbi:MAG: glycoside hydrolase family 97 protein [Bacteroidota bacterium]